MERYLRLKKRCCEKMQQKWETMMKDSTQPNIIDNEIQSEKALLFDYYIDLKAALEKIPDKNFVEIERSKMFEKMVELAEFNNGTDLGQHYFQVRRGAIATKPIAFIMAIMGPGYVETSNLISADDLEDNLDKVQILYFGKKVTAILPGTCEDMTRLKNVYFHPDTLCSIIDDSAFQGCTLLEKMRIPDQVKSIGYACFADCDSLSDMEFGNKVESIWHSAFQNCTKLKKIHVTDSVKYIGDECFRINTDFGYEGGLTEITGMKNLEELGYDVFKGTNITMITLGPRLIKIGRTCFEGTPLQTITMEYNSNLEIEYDAFNNLRNLKTVNLRGGNAKKWIEKLKRQFQNCWEIHMLSERWQPQIEQIRIRNKFNWEVSDEVIYIAYRPILEQEMAQLMLKGIPTDVTRYIAEEFSPPVGSIYRLRNNKVVIFNGKGSENWTANHYRNLENMKPTYSPTIGQYCLLFSNIIKNMIERNLNINDYYVLCPVYQNHENVKKNDEKIKKNTLKWYDYFDYQIAVTGKAKESEVDINTTMHREVNEELNVTLNIESITNDLYFKKFRFGWGIVDYSLPVIPSFDDNDKEDVDKRVIVAVLENKNNINRYHVNNHTNCEYDIIGFIRKDLTEIINMLKSDIEKEINNSDNIKYIQKLLSIQNEGYI